MVKRVLKVMLEGFFGLSGVMYWVLIFLNIITENIGTIEIKDL